MVIQEYNSRGAFLGLTPEAAGWQKLREEMAELCGGPCWVKDFAGRMIPGKILSSSMDEHKVRVEYAVPMGETRTKTMNEVVDWKVFRDWQEEMKGEDLKDPENYLELLAYSFGKEKAPLVMAMEQALKTGKKFRVRFKNRIGDIIEGLLISLEPNKKIFEVKLDPAVRRSSAENPIKTGLTENVISVEEEGGAEN